MSNVNQGGSCIVRGGDRGMLDLVTQDRPRECSTTESTVKNTLVNLIKIRLRFSILIRTFVETTSDRFVNDYLTDFVQVVFSVILMLIRGRQYFVCVGFRNLILETCEIAN